MIKGLRQQRADLVAQGAAIIAAAGERGLTAEDATKHDAILAELDQVNASITRVERQMDAERKLTPVETVVDHGARIEVGRDNRASEPWGPEIAANDSIETRRYKADFGLGRQLMAIKRAKEDGHVDPRLKAAIVGAGESVGSDGGFAVGTDISTEILREARQTSMLYAPTNKIPISSGSNAVKIPAVHETSRATGSRWGGIRGYWVAEGDSITGSKPIYRQLQLNLHKLGAYYTSTDELEMDAAALGAIVRQAVSEEFGWLIDNAILRGTGAGQPLGVLNAGCLISVAKEGGQAAATILFENVVKMWGRLYSRARTAANWYINQDTEQQLLQMAMVIGTGGVPVYMPADGTAARPFSTLFGRPVVTIEQCSTLGTVGDIILGNFGWYVVAEKGGVQEASSIHVNFQTDQTAYRFTIRLDGQPIWSSALTPANGTVTVSPFVALDTRA